MTSDASFLAVSARSNDANGKKKDAGHVRVFRYDPSNNAYIQIGDDIDGDRGEKAEDGLYYVGDKSGHSLALSDAVSSGAIRVAIGSPYNADAGGYHNGHVRLFEYNTASSSEASWDQVLQDIAGETSREEAGRGVAMSKDGTRIVVGSPHYGREGNGYYRGAVRVYEEALYADHSMLPYIAPIVPIVPRVPIVPTARFQIKSSSNGACISATLKNKLVARPCITSIDSPLRKYQIWTIDNFGQLRLHVAGAGDDLCVSSVSRKLITTTCRTSLDTKMQFLIPEGEGPIKLKKNGKEFVVGFNLNNGRRSRIPVRLFREKVSNPPSNIFSFNRQKTWIQNRKRPIHFDDWSIQEMVE